MAKKTAKNAAPERKRVKKQPGTAAYEKRLLNMRQDILKMVNEQQEMDMPDNQVGDEADAATQSAERELLFELSDNERQRLDAIEAALRKIVQSRFGICENCGKKIGAQRLKAIPQARYCISCQSRFDTPRG